MRPRATEAREWGGYARYLYLQQLRGEVRRGELIATPKAAHAMAAFMAQLEFGDEGSTSLSAEDYLKLLDGTQALKTLEAAGRITAMHRRLSGMSKSDAADAYMQAAERLPGFGIDSFWCYVPRAGACLLGLSHQGFSIAVPDSKDVAELTWERTRRAVADGDSVKLEWASSSSGEAVADTFQFESPAAAKAVLAQIRAVHAAAMKKPRRGPAPLDCNAAPPAAAAAKTSPATAKVVPATEAEAAWAVQVERDPSRGFGLALVGPARGAPARGVFVAHVAPDGNAEAAGLKRGDRVLSVNGAGVSMLDHGAATDVVRAAGHRLDLRLTADPHMWREYASLLAQNAVASASPGHDAGSRPGPGTAWATERSVASHESGELREQLLSVAIALEPGEELGLSLTGGADDCIIPGDASVFLNTLVPGGAMHRDGRARVADRLVQINGVVLKDHTHEDAVALVRDAMATGVLGFVLGRAVPASAITPEQEALGRSGGEVRFGSRGQLVAQVQAWPQPETDGSLLIRTGPCSPMLQVAPAVPCEARTITLHRLPGETSVGIRIVGPPDAAGVYVADVVPGSAAARLPAQDGLRRGDRILDVNGLNTESKAPAEVAAALGCIPVGAPSTMTVAHDPEGFSHTATREAGAVDRLRERASGRRDPDDALAIVHCSAGSTAPDASFDSLDAAPVPPESPRPVLDTFGSSDIALVGGGDHGLFVAADAATAAGQHPGLRELLPGDEVLQIGGRSTARLCIADALQLIAEADADDQLSFEVRANPAGYAAAAGVAALRQVCVPVGENGALGVTFDGADDGPPTVTALRPEATAAGLCIGDVLRQVSAPDGGPMINLGGCGHEEVLAAIRAASAASASVYFTVTASAAPQSPGESQAEQPPPSPAVQLSKSIVSVERRATSVTRCSPVKPSPARPIILMGPDAAATTALANSLVAVARREGIDVDRVVRTTSRPARVGEINGVDYHFVATAAFRAGISARAFVEVGQFNGAYYGTAVCAIAAPARAGRAVVCQLPPAAVSLLRRDASDILPHLVPVGSTGATHLTAELQSLAVPAVEPTDNLEAAAALVLQRVAVAASRGGTPAKESQSPQPARLAQRVPITTRPPRRGEVDGHDYHFVDAARFDELEAAGEIGQSGTYKGHNYGTLASAADDLRGQRPLIRSRTLAAALGPAVAPQSGPAPAEGPDPDAAGKSKWLARTQSAAEGPSRRLSAEWQGTALGELAQR